MMYWEGDPLSLGREMYWEGDPISLGRSECTCELYGLFLTFWDHVLLFLGIPKEEVG